MDHQRIGLLFERIVAAVRGKMLSSFAIEFKNDRAGEVILNDNPDELIASGDRSELVAPSEIQIIRVRISSAFYHPEGWPTALDDALNRLEAAVIVAPAREPKEEEREGGEGDGRESGDEESSQ